MLQWQVPREEQTIEDLRPGYRRFNWVWYHPLPASRLPDMLRGADAVQYEVSIPLPQVRQGQRKSDGQSSQCPYFTGCEYIQTRKAAYCSPFVILVHRRRLYRPALGLKCH
jgi:hypothetical protein